VHRARGEKSGERERPMRKIGGATGEIVRPHSGETQLKKEYGVPGKGSTLSWKKRALGGDGRTGRIPLCPSKTTFLKYAGKQGKTK